jgi:hypothetical protein
MRWTPSGYTSRYNLAGNAPTLGLGDRLKVCQWNLSMPSGGIASQAVRVTMALQIGKDMQVRPDDFPIFCKAATALAKEDLRATSTKPECLARCLLRCLLDGRRYGPQPHGLALCAVAEVRGQFARLRSEVITIQGIRSRHNRQGPQRLSRFVRSRLGIEHCRDVAFAGQRQHYMPFHALTARAHVPKSGRSLCVAAPVVRDTQHAADKDLSRSSEMKRLRKLLMNAPRARCDPGIRANRSDRQRANRPCRKQGNGDIATSGIRCGHCERWVRSEEQDHGDQKDQGALHWIALSARNFAKNLRANPAAVPPSPCGT